MRYSIMLFFILVLTGCESRKTTRETESVKTPKEVVIAYLAATNRFDYKEAEKFLIPNKKNLLDLETLKKMEKSLPDDRKATFLNKEKNAGYYEKSITDSTAQYFVNPDQDAVSPIEFNLKKVNNNWMIESVITH